MNEELSLSKIRGAKNFMLRSTTLALYTAKKGGLGKAVAESLAEMYFEQVENCRRMDEIELLYIKMYIDYTKRVKNLVQVDANSKIIRECCRYINDRIYENISFLNSEG